MKNPVATAMAGSGRKYWMTDTAEEKVYEKM
jgi:hypothetical protein